MPVRPGAPAGETIKEFHTGKTYARTRKKFGKKRADKQAVAVGLATERKRPRRK